MTEFQCTKCAEKFERVGVFVAHYRHKHTDYDKVFEREDKQLRKCRGMTAFQRKLMAKQRARLAIEEEIEAQVKALEAKHNEEHRVLS